MNTNHALKIEDLKIDLKQADEIKEVLSDFLEHGLNFRADRISILESRSRDGFIPYSHNKGGVEAIGFMDQSQAEYELSHIFENSHKTLEKYRGYDLKQFKEDNKIPQDAELDETQIDKFDDYRINDESTVLLSADLMLTDENTLDIRLCVCVKDAPYHRTYDDMLSLDVEFDSILELVDGLNEVLKNKWVIAFADAANETF